MKTQDAKQDGPLVSCIMPTADRRPFVARAVAYFRRQDYAARELIVVDDGRDAVGDLVPEGERVRYVRLEKKLTVGAKRNLACELARGEVIAHWDDDDWHAPRRLGYQIGALLGAGADVCGISTLLFYEPAAGRGWLYSYPPREKLWLGGSTLCYRREFWSRNRFREINVGEDARFVWDARGARMIALQDSTFHVGLIHPKNVSPKRTGGSYWKPHPAERIRELMGADAEFYDRLREGGAAQDAEEATEKSGPVKRETIKREAIKRAASRREATGRDAAGRDAAGREATLRVATVCEATGCGETGREAGVREAASSQHVAPAARASRSALVSAAYGVGDILRVTPLVRALARMGYAVDVLLAPDYAEAASLLEGAPEIRRLFVCEDFRATKGAKPVPGVADEEYDLAAFTVWSAPLKRQVRARRTFEFSQRDWLREGDAASAEKIARAAGYEGEMPAPFAVAGARRFRLAPGTVALHPGCKPDWPWKKWHGFAELARLFASVVLVGTESDLRNDATYFGREFDWPTHARSFVGRLSLRATAALLGECAALVSNDSGLMHLGVAVGTPTFGVFGITSPARETIRSPLMHAVTKNLACEPQCRRGAWGRRDCERHLECLRTLTAEEVYARVTEQLPHLGAGKQHAAAPDDAASSALEISDSTAAAVNARDAGSKKTNGEKANGEKANGEKANGEMANDARPARMRSQSANDEATERRPAARVAPSTPVVDEAEELSLVYYGYVFDASGYGHAARAYIHALAAAGVRLSVVPLSNRPREVRDELIESLVGRRVEADFHLFHGIPPHWAARAQSLPNAIGMTVWETDAMPAQWRGALSRVLEVWLPCEHNVSVFRAALERPVFKLPHPLPPPARADGDRAAAACDLPGVGPDDFVFYSIFEWQQRKSPRELIETYLREFAAASDAVLVVKTNASAERAAEESLQQARRATGSRARVVVRAEQWSGARIDALHERGDCYLSLHRGEGWGYPAFEAAARGKPVVATAHSGPLEYLDADAHGLVRCRPAAVRQSYVYYTPRMRWAEPDFAHAAELMRRVYEERDPARERAARAAAELRERFSLETVGRAARAELARLLHGTNPAKARRLTGSALPCAEGEPLAGAWYDADYFEHGIKSNWERGYTWRLFGDLFRRAAHALAETFAESETFLDAGCAKGFLVRALRETGKDCRGFDHSPWAVAQADEAARPFVALAGVDDYQFDRDADVLLALNLFETLTEDQAARFLARSRAHTRHALCAVIQSFADDAERAAYERGSRDLSQRTLRTRDWWRETILAAGWRQNALARLVERRLQAHELPRKMNWQVYVFAPE